MRSFIDRRSFLKLTGLGGIVFASGLGFDVMAKTNGNGKSGELHHNDFFFVQLSDTHWGFSGNAINPDAQLTLPKAIDRVNALKHQPDFVVFTGDLTHTTDDPQQRRQRMKEFSAIVSTLRVKNIRFIPGEHDASLDQGEAYREFFGPLHYSFDHKGIHFIVLDNVSDPAANLGAPQLDWLKADLEQLKPEAPIVVLTHRPLFDLYPQWDWFTRDGQAAIEMLLPHRNVAVFYGHIHQEHQYKTEHIAHYAAKSLIFPLPAPGSAPKRAPIPWDTAKPYSGLGFRNVKASLRKHDYAINEQVLGEGEKP
ncbi:metallophosphoesterase [Candidatus Methylospira mobilis]|uniref:Metallophosphoesterase n=1 Tax=Candidatus Methylospira mobilis TaxID=1808979 RepID=A0A5Q0BD10_9GAMM|nr:metallophosphoesterase [Candidatus Methylospira mobilis]QFY41755.1 metallophosphoesterase [Candidatus Methylospira mobilis]WNV06613.1 metallophosphoesterase [Candidatus Methylospira mobilis]